MQNTHWAKESGPWLKWSRPLIDRAVVLCPYPFTGIYNLQGNVYPLCLQTPIEAADTSNTASSGLSLCLQSHGLQCKVLTNFCFVYMAFYGLVIQLILSWYFWKLKVKLSTLSHNPNVCGSHSIAINFGKQECWMEFRHGSHRGKTQISYLLEELNFINNKNEETRSTSLIQHMPR